MDNIQLTYKEKSEVKEKLPVVIFLDNLTDPRNTGMIFRLSDAFAIKEIYLGGTTPAPPNIKIKRTARGTEKLVPFQKTKESTEVLKALKKEGYRLIALEITTSSKDIKDFDFKPYTRICIIAGSEEHGISQEVLEIADDTLHIEMLGHGLSMNVSNSVAIMIYEATKHLIRKSNS